MYIVKFNIKKYMKKDSNNINMIYLVVIFFSNVIIILFSNTSCITKNKSKHN